MCGLDALDILQKSLRDGEVVGLSYPCGHFLRPRCGRESPVCLDSSTPSRLSDSFAGLGTAGVRRGRGRPAEGRGGVPRVRSVNGTPTHRAESCIVLEEGDSLNLV